ncbi:MAG: tandem-95 repeat protein [Cyclobacteriaceae bacterium]
MESLAQGGGAPPEMHGDTTTVDYTENDGYTTIDASLFVSSSRLKEGYVSISSNYNLNEDTLYFSGTTSISYTWDDANGTLNLGGGTDTDYMALLSAIQYGNSSDDPNTATREITFWISNNKGEVFYSKNIQITAVNDAPYAYFDDQSVAVDTLTFEGVEGSTVEMCLSIIDLEDDAFTIEAGALTNSSGSLSLTDQCYTYTPNAGFSGTDFVTVSICDAVSTTLCSQVVLSISVDGINDVPAVSGTTTTTAFTENQTDFILTEDIAVTDDNANLQSATIQISEGFITSEDSLYISGEIQMTTNWDDVDGVLSITGSNTLNAYVSALRKVAYFNKSENPTVANRKITYKVSDGAETSNGFVVETTISAVNDKPYFVEEGKTTELDTIKVSLNEDGGYDGCLAVYDHEGNATALTAGELVNGLGVFTLDSENSCYSYVPGSNQFGTDYVTINVCEQDDNTACGDVVIQFTIQAINDAPVIVLNGSEVDSLYEGTDLNTTLSYCFQTEDLDGDGTFISQLNAPFIIGSASNMNGLCFDYTPATDSVGSEFIEVIICDNNVNSLCDTVIFQIEFPDVNTLHTFNYNGGKVDTISLGMSVGDTLSAIVDLIDREKDGFILDTAFSSTENGWFAAAVNKKELSLSFYQNADDSVLNYTANVKVCDDRDPRLCAELIVEVSVNYPPLLLAEAESFTLNTLENDTVANCYELYDFNEQPIFVKSITPSTNGSLTASIEDQNSSLCVTYAPNQHFVGLDTFTVVLCDNGNPTLCTTETFYTQSFLTNTVPVVSGLDSISKTFDIVLDENDSTSGCQQMTDHEGDMVSIDTVVVVSGTGMFEADIDSSGNLCHSFRPEVYNVDPFVVQVTICDDNPFSLCETITFSYAITPFNIAPIANVDSVELTDSHFFELDLLMNDVDEENEGLYLDMDFELSPTIGMATYFSDSTIEYQPDPDEYKGVDLFEYRVCDNGVPQECVMGQVYIVYTLEIPELEIYEGFSPNGDGINDVWFIEGIREFEKAQVRVTDQWNNLVYQSTGYDNRNIVWDGTSNLGAGKELKNGTYYYYIDLGIGERPVTGFVILRR